MLEKIEHQEKLIQYFSKFIPDKRCSDKLNHGINKMPKLSVFSIIQGYGDWLELAENKIEDIFRLLLIKS